MEIVNNSKNHSTVLASLPTRTLWTLLWLLLLLHAPYFIKSIVVGHYPLSASFILTIVSASIYLLPLIKRKTPPISVFLPLSCIGLGLILGIYFTGIKAAFWAYPCIISFYFVVSIREATILSLLLLIISAAALFIHEDWGLTLRFVFSTIMECILIRIITAHVFVLKEKLVTLSIIDSLTGAFNRRYLDEQLHASILNRDNATLLLLDIDHFKQVNDQFGHEMGDRVLRDIVECMKKNSRQHDLVFRMGGEEFVMLLPNTELLPAEVYANFLRVELAKILIGTSNNNITVSIGLSELSTHQSTDDWLRQADQCLYRAKSEGRDRVIVVA